MSLVFYFDKSDPEHAIESCRMCRKSSSSSNSNDVNYVTFVTPRFEPQPNAQNGTKRYDRSAAAESNGDYKESIMWRQYTEDLRLESELYWMFHSEPMTECFNESISFHGERDGRKSQTSIQPQCSS